MSASVLAALDVGTNSFHLVIARMRSGGGFDIVTREKEVVRLGHGGGEMKHLEPDAIQRGLTVLDRMARLAESQGAPLRAVATSAVREARNADEFLDAAREIGVNIEVISGVEEARLIHLGVLQAVPYFDRRMLLIDIGGGSTEILVGEHGQMLTARSFKLGAVRLTDRFFGKGVVTEDALDECRSYVRSALTTYEREIRRTGFDAVVVSSGTAEAVARMVHLAEADTPLRTYNCFTFGVDAVKQAVARLAAAPSTRARAEIPGIDDQRADIIVAGAVILETVCEAFGVENLTYSEFALREGVLLDTLGRMAGGGMQHLRNVAMRSVRHLAERCDDDLAHSAHVARLALQIYDGTQAIHGLDAACRNYLEAGALLANVGLVISHSKHHMHSYYVIRNTDDLTGFTDHEIEIVALVARYHRKSEPKPSHTEFGRLEPEWQRAVRILAGILRVAIGLDRSHDQRITSVGVRRDGHRLILDLHPKRGTPDLDLECYSAADRSDLFEDVLGLELRLQPLSPR